MTEQLDLLSYQPTAEELTPPVAPDNIQPANPHLVAWWQGQADFYLRLMAKLAPKAAQKAHLKHEINRLHNLRSQALERLKNLGEN